MMTMPVTIEIADSNPSSESIDKVFQYLDYVDRKFSFFRPDSEVSAINRGGDEWPAEKWSDDMKLVMALSEKTKNETDGFFDIRRSDGRIDPSGLVKGWMIYNSAEILKADGYKNFYIDIGGDIQTYGKNKDGMDWRIGIRHPFQKDKIVKVISGENLAVATSGTYERGKHIYNPKTGKTAESDIASISIIGPNVYEADRFATAAFAMGREGINFIASLLGFEGMMIDNDGVATMTDGFEKYAIKT
jgi:thiamine biosynthesis lipoprotein